MMIIFPLLSWFILANGILPAGGLGATCAVAPLGCQAVAMYVVAKGDILYNISKRFHVSNFSTLAQYNQLRDAAVIQAGQRLDIPFSCPCAASGHVHDFYYSVDSGDTIHSIASFRYGNLTTSAAILAANPQLNYTNINQSLQSPQTLIVPVKCFCGDGNVSTEYGLFGTYAAQLEDASFFSLGGEFGVSAALLQSYNPNLSNITPYSSIIFIPAKNLSTGIFPALIPTPSSDQPKRSNLGIIVGAVAGTVILIIIITALGIYTRRRNTIKYSDQRAALINTPQRPARAASVHSLIDIDSSASSLAQCIKFGIEELSGMTNNFSPGNEIGRGGFATVFYGEKQGQKLAIKRMEMRASKEFMNEFKILSCVNHANLLQLIGYCIDAHLFLVYEYIENGTLAEHLHGGHLSWEKRVSIALDVARAMEYIHEYSGRTYIHHDLKPSNVLLDKNYHAKVGDFGLTRLMKENSNGFTNTYQGCGTYGYLAPEYAQFGHVSVKVDVYAFGVILFQLITGQNALIGESKRELVTLMREAIEDPNSMQVQSFIDPILDVDNMHESIQKMAILATKCTHKDHEARPFMKDVVMELIEISRHDFNS